MLDLLRRFLPFALLATALSGVLFLVMQRTIRSEADDLPRQIAEDAAALLENGTGPANIIGTFSVDAARSLSPFLMVFGTNGSVIASSGTIDDQPFVPPTGILQAALATGEHRVTWQPREDIRLATVIRSFSGERDGFVLAARSLRAADERLADILTIILIGWGIALAASLLGAALWPRRKHA
jgi:hypothetical protein